MKTDKLTTEELTLLSELAAMSDADIDTTDIPEAPEAHWKSEGNAFYRPKKQSITIRLDMDIITCFKHKYEHGYQTQINRVLREYTSKMNIDQWQDIDNRQKSGVPAVEIISIKSSLTSSPMKIENNSTINRRLERRRNSQSPRPAQRAFVKRMA